MLFSNPDCSKLMNMAPNKKKIPIGWSDIESISSMIPMERSAFKSSKQHLSGPRYEWQLWFWENNKHILLIFNNIELITI